MSAQLNLFDGDSLAVSALGTGSTGNAYLAVCGETRVLIDAGLGVRDLGRRLRAVGCEAEQLDAVVLTHGHDDHVGSAVAIAAGRIPVYCTERTYRSAAAHAPPRKQPIPLPTHRLIAAGRTFAIGSLEITPLAVPHDWPDTLGFVLDAGGGRRVGIATDVGFADEALLDGLARCATIFFEFNHDSDLLRLGPYPPALKARVAGPGGHLPNDEAGESLARLLGPDTIRVIAVHLSQTNNRPHLVSEALASGLAKIGARVETAISAHDRPTPLFVADRPGSESQL